MFGVHAHAHRRRHDPGPLFGGAGLGASGAHHGAAVAAVGHHQDAHTGLEVAEFEIQLVVDQLAVEQAPGLVLFVGFFAAHIRYLAAMA